MTQQEFTQRTKVEVDYNEFWEINEVYNNSGIDKDEFCKMWCKINKNRIQRMKEAKKLQEKKEKEIKMLGKIHEKLSNSTWNTRAAIILTDEECTFIGNKGISVTYPAQTWVIRQDVYCLLKRLCKTA